MKRRIISLLMALVMILGLVPTTVWATAAESAADTVQRARIPGWRRGRRRRRYRRGRKCRAEK